MIGRSEVQVALVIRRFVIRGFDYLRPVNCVQNSFYADISLDYLRFRPFLMGKTALKGQNSGPLLFAVLVLAGYSWDVTPANNEGRLYRPTNLRPLLTSIWPYQAPFTSTQLMVQNLLICPLQFSSILIPSRIA